MRVTFHTDRIKSVMLFVHRLTATERASIDTVITDQNLTVFLTLVRTSVEELKRFMQSVPGGEAMAETVKEVTEQVNTNVLDGPGVTFTIADEMPPGPGFTQTYEADGRMMAPFEWKALLDADPNPLADIAVHWNTDSRAYNAMMHEMNNGPYAIIDSSSGTPVVVETGRVVNGVFKADAVPQKPPFGVLRLVKRPGPANEQ